MINQIVATWHNLLIVRDGEIVESLSEPNTGHYGVTWNSDYLFALFADTSVTDGTNQNIRLFDHQLNPVRDILMGEIAGVHQILWSDGMLWITSTNDDTIVIADEQGEIIKRWRPVPEFDEKHPGKQHVNSIWINNGYIYTIAHGLNFGNPAIYCHNESFDMIFKRAIRRRAHNVYRHREKLFYIQNGMVVFQNGSEIYVGEGMMKGLSVTDNRIYVGSSRIIEDRATRLSNPYGVLFELDYDFNTITNYQLDAGPVGEIRTLNQKDYAHHGMVWAGRYGKE